MKISLQNIYLTIAILAIVGCNNQSNKETEDGRFVMDTVSLVDSTVQKVVTGTDSSKKSLQFKDISFDITTKGTGTYKKTVIVSKGFDINETIAWEGEPLDVQVADLNEDGFPELLIFSSSIGSGSYGSVMAYSANGKKSMSQVYFPLANENPKLKKGYMGHDHFSIHESRLIQEFPIYKEDDPNSSPSGGIRRVQYKLVDGEASITYSRIKKTGLRNITERYPLRKSMTIS